MLEIEFPECHAFVTAHRPLSKDNVFQQCDALVKKACLARNLREKKYTITDDTGCNVNNLPGHVPEPNSEE